jgi:hypothetical protein
MTTADICLKAFTTKITEENNNQGEMSQEVEKNDNTKELKIVSEYYKIEEGYISRVDALTTIEIFKKNITTNASVISFYTSDNKEITDSSTILSTGMKVKFENNKMYTIIVRGDLNCDGVITLTDLSKLIAHFNEMKGFELTGNPLRAADLNSDGKITLTDISQLVVIFSKL